MQLSKLARLDTSYTKTKPSLFHKYDCVIALILFAPAIDTNKIIRKSLIKENNKRKCYKTLLRD